jgi:hypothetical protein
LENTAKSKYSITNMSRMSESATLPHEMLQRIMCFLCRDIRALSLAARVSKHWAAATNSRTMWLRMSQMRWSSKIIHENATHGAHALPDTTDEIDYDVHDMDRGDRDLDQGGHARRNFLTRVTGTCLESAMVVRYSYACAYVCMCVCVRLWYVFMRMYVYECMCMHTNAHMC